MYKFAILFISCFLVAEIHVHGDDNEASISVEANPATDQVPNEKKSHNEITSVKDDLATDKALEDIFNKILFHIKRFSSKFIKIQEFWGFTGISSEDKMLVKAYLMKEKKIPLKPELTLDLDLFKDLTKMVFKELLEKTDVAKYAYQRFYKVTNTLSPEDERAAIELLKSIFIDYKTHILSPYNYLNQRQFFQLLGDDEKSKTAVMCYNEQKKFQGSINNIIKAKSSYSQTNSLDRIDVNDFIDYMKEASKAHGKDIFSFANECFKVATSSTPGGLIAKEQLTKIFNDYRTYLETKDDRLSMEQFFQFLGYDNYGLFSQDAVMEYLGLNRIEAAMQYSVGEDEFILYMSVVAKKHSENNDIVYFTEDCFDKATHKTTKNEASTSVQVLPIPPIKDEGSHNEKMSTPVEAEPTKNEASPSVHCPSPTVDEDSYKETSTSAQGSCNEDGASTSVQSSSTEGGASTSVESDRASNKALESIFDEYLGRLGSVLKSIEKNRFFKEFLGDENKYRKAVDNYNEEKRRELAKQPKINRKIGHLYSSTSTTIDLNQFQSYMKVVCKAYNKDAEDRKNVVTFAKECLENATRLKTPTKDTTTEMGKIKL